MSATIAVEIHGLPSPSLDGVLLLLTPERHTDETQPRTTRWLSPTEEFHDASVEFRRIRQYLHPLDLVKASDAYAAGTVAASHAAKSLARVVTTKEYC